MKTQASFPGYKIDYYSERAAQVREAEETILDNVHALAQKLPKPPVPRRQVVLEVEEAVPPRSASDALSWIRRRVDAAIASAPDQETRSRIFKEYRAVAESVEQLQAGIQSLQGDLSRDVVKEEAKAIETARTAQQEEQRAASTQKDQDRAWMSPEQFTASYPQG